jgi:HK97 family phage prohead protease
MQFKNVAFAVKEVTGRTVTGYAATWDEDQGGDVILPGAFTKTLQERGNRVKVLWQHYHPIGKPTLMREDDKGLYAEYTISETPQGNEALTLIKDGVIDTMSIGYEAVKSDRPDMNGPRFLREVKLFEFSPVTFAMNDAAVITGVKSIREALRTGGITAADREPLLETLEEIKALLTKEAKPVPTSHGLQPQQVEQLRQLEAAIKSYRI